MVSMQAQPKSQVQPVSSVYAYEVARGRGRGRATPQVGGAANGLSEGRYPVYL